MYPLAGVRRRRHNGRSSVSGRNLWNTESDHRILLESKGKLNELAN
jgi:hypothetical protein